MTCFDFSISFCGFLCFTWIFNALCANQYNLLQNIQFCIVFAILWWPRNNSYQRIDPAEWFCMFLLHFRQQQPVWKMHIWLQNIQFCIVFAILWWFRNDSYNKIDPAEWFCRFVLQFRRQQPIWRLCSWLQNIQFCIVFVIFWGFRKDPYKK